MKDGGPYREGGESCASCVELARENGELRAANKTRTHTTWLQTITGSLMVGGMVSAALMATGWIHGCATAPPDPVDMSCKDSAEIIQITSWGKTCSHGASLVAEPIFASGHVLVRCVCPGSVRNDVPAGAR